MGPAEGHRVIACDRKLAYRESRPCQNGELALIASNTGNHTRMRSSTPTASASDSTDTCT